MHLSHRDVEHDSQTSLLKADRRRPNGRRSAGRRLQNHPGQQNPDILDRRNQVVLDLLPPQTAPPRPLEPVIVGLVPLSRVCLILAKLVLLPQVAAFPRCPARKEAPFQVNPSAGKTPDVARGHAHPPPGAEIVPGNLSARHYHRADPIQKRLIAFGKAQGVSRHVNRILLLRRPG